MEEYFSCLVAEEEARFSSEVPWTFAYGTAGFRDQADKLDRVMFRIGILAVLRSKSVKAAIGAAITASHNPIQDNGVKMVDPMGEMLLQEWEGHATLLVNASASELVTVLCDIVASTGCDITAPAHVIVARDTRPSGERLVKHLIRAAELLQSKVTDYGILTTPQLHYVVRCVNTHGQFGEPSEEGYYQKLVTAFNQLLPQPLPQSLTTSVKVDGANGVGADKLRRLMQCFAEVGGAQPLTIHVCNDGSAGVLNHNCGADYVKTRQKPPEGMSYGEGEKCVSFDGDADRIVYFYKSTDGKFKLLDGDKIAALAAGFICECLKVMKTDLTIGVVQTAYSNGSATAYLTKTLGVSVACTSTGVKHLHHKAQDFDVGIYFESNGHGTILFNNRASETFKMAAEDGRSSDVVRAAAIQLLALTQLVNQAVGDAISDLLLVEVILLLRGWGCVEWDMLYRELPCRELKVKVKDRMMVQTTDFARTCVSPGGLQGEIDQLVGVAPQGRAFVRPSGTEDVVRIYAEAAVQESADNLAVQVGVKVHQMADGIGEVPSLQTTHPPSY